MKCEMCCSSKTSSRSWGNNRIKCLVLYNILICYLWEEKAFKSNVILIWKCRYKPIGINNLCKIFLSATYAVKLTSTQQKAAACLPLRLQLMEPSLHFQYPFNHLPISFTKRLSSPFHFIGLQLFSLSGSRPKGKMYKVFMSLKTF